MRHVFAYIALLSLLATRQSLFADEPQSPSIDLSHWKLTLPVDASGKTDGHPMEIQAQRLSGGYKHADYFYKDANGQFVFWCPVNGARTENTEYARTELREVIDPEDDNVCWSAPGTHVLNARCRVSEVPSSQKVIIGQIHGYSGKAKPLIKLQFFKGRIEALVKEKATKGKDLKLTFPDVGLDKDFDYEIKLQAGLLSITVNGATQSLNVFEKDLEWAKQSLYFKAGVYPQDNEGPPTEGARVSFSRLVVNHSKGYQWKLDVPLLNLVASEGGKPIQLFDPTAVQADGLWHIFGGGPQYFTLKELKPGSTVPRSVKLSIESLFVPQVFFFRPTQQWQMIGQIPDTTGRYPKNAPVLSTNARIDDPKGWSKPVVLNVPPPENVDEPIKNWNDFYVICDDAKAHLLATSAGKLWRSETKLADFPHGWSKPVVALAGDFIYAIHTYRQDTATGQPRYWLNVTGVSVDAATKQRRQYQHSYIADRIEGPWRTEAATWENPFAGPTNIRFTDNRWHGDLVHGEPIRLGNDERMILGRNVTGFIFHGHFRDTQTGRMADKSEFVGLLEHDASTK